MLWPITTAQVGYPDEGGVIVYLSDEEYGNIKRAYSMLNSIRRQAAISKFGSIKEEDHGHQGSSQEEVAGNAQSPSGHGNGS